MACSSSVVKPVFPVLWRSCGREGEEGRKAGKEGRKKGRRGEGEGRMLVTLLSRVDKPLRVAHLLSISHSLPLHPTNLHNPRVAHLLSISHSLLLHPTNLHNLSPEGFVFWCGELTESGEQCSRPVQCHSSLLSKSHPQLCAKLFHNSLTHSSADLE